MPQVEQMIILFVFCGNYTNQLFAALVPVKWHSMKVSYEILINHKNVPKKVFPDVSLDDKTWLCSITTGRTNDNIVRILWELHKLVICSIGPC